MGALLALVGAMGLVYWFVAGLFLDKNSPELAWQGSRILSAVIFAVVGVVVYVLGKPIGRFVGKGLNG